MNVPRMYWISNKGYRYMTHIVYHGVWKPTDDISDARWDAIVNHIMREYYVPFFSKIN